MDKINFIYFNYQKKVTLARIIFMFKSKKQDVVLIRFLLTIVAEIEALQHILSIC